MKRIATITLMLVVVIFSGCGTSGQFLGNTVGGILKQELQIKKEEVKRYVKRELPRRVARGTAQAIAREVVPEHADEAAFRVGAAFDALVQ